ncbi:MAG: LD-carboxypeptidase [Crocinitomicaceae bacterium]|nr:LD-carboxypeptidase [Crocinitomicaceae bacterium]
MRTPPFLSKGDTIVLVAPGKAIEKEHIDFAVQFWEQNGFLVEKAPHLLHRNGYFSGSVAERCQDMQWALDHPTAKAIICARGGYGAVQLVQRLNWSHFLLYPKWIVGFSDVTVFHAFAQRNEIASLHATMPLNYAENSEASLTKQLDFLQGKKLQLNWSSTATKNGQVEGALVGGNFAVFQALINTPYFPNMKNKILFLEEVGEYYYAIDRMLYQLSLTGILDDIKGCIIGGLTNCSDMKPGYQTPIENIFLEHFKYRNIPFAMHLSAGHLDHNLPVPLGVNALFEVTKDRVSLRF